MGGLGAQLRIKPPTFIVIPVPSFPHTEQLLFLVMHEFSLFTLHVTQVLALVIFAHNPAYPLRIFHPPFLFTRLQLLLIVFHLFLHGLSDMANP